MAAGGTYSGMKLWQNRDITDAPTSYIGLELCPPVRRTSLIRAKPDRIPNRSSALCHIKTVGTLITWFLVRCRGIPIVMLDRVVPPSHIVTQQATSYRTGIPVIGGIKNSFWISPLLSKNHRDIVVEAQRGDVEKHLRSHYDRHGLT